MLEDTQPTSMTNRETCCRQTGTEGNTFYSYNAFNQQTAVVMANGDRLESRYDPEKLRAQTKENGKIINFLYHQGELVAELNDQGEPQGRYILGVWSGSRMEKRERRDTTPIIWMSRKVPCTLQGKREPSRIATTMMPLD